MISKGGGDRHPLRGVAPEGNAAGGVTPMSRLLTALHSRTLLAQLAGQSGHDGVGGRRWKFCFCAGDRDYMSHTTTGNGRATPATLSQLRHDIRNYLNAIKLSAALLQRRCKDTLDLESITEIDRSA